MEDFSALASRIAVGVGEVRGCLILSRDGLVLGSFPAGEEHLVKPAWVRFAAMGDPEKGFVEFSDELWVYVRRGPYAAFAVAGTGIRPGLLIEHLEQALLAAEEARSKREALRIPEVPPAPSGRPRTSLHRDVRSVAPAPVPAPAAGRAADEGPPRPAAPAPGPAGSEAPGGGPPSGTRAGDAAGPSTEPAGAAARDDRRGAPTDAGAQAVPDGPADPEGAEEEGEVDRVLLAQEFSRLLQESRLDDEA